MFPSDSPRETLRFSGNKINYFPREQSTTGELYDCGPPREQQYTSMQNTEDRNAPIRAVENQPITAQLCALYANAQPVDLIA